MTTRALIVAGWQDAPHLTEQAKAELAASYLPHEIEARTLGIPSLGRGAVYPLAQESYTCDPFQVPDHYARAYGLDVGWNWTAAVWWAHDRDNDIEYIYREYIREQAPPDVHVAAIKGANDWIPGAIDPAAKARSQVDGRNLFTEYSALGLKLHLAENAVEAGILHVYQRLASGKLKIFRTCGKLLEEMRFYQRDERGLIKKERDHLNDGMRYVVMTGPRIAKPKPGPPVQVRTSRGEWAWG